MLTPPRSFTLWTAILAAAAFSLVSEAALNSIQRQSSGISWFSCPDSNKTQCAFFDVPRDYSDQAENYTVSIFLRKLPANVSEEDRLGTILTNPGAGLHIGPGVSGTAWIEMAGEELSTIVEGRYDIIGFDPRLVKTINALFAGHSAACVKNGNHKMLEASGTTFVVQDMERIVEALGEDGINYWGYSYGTILGATFAAMRPDLVKRMILDGVSNAESYFNDVWQWGRDGMAETYKTFAGFLSTCIEAGPKYCAFAVPPAGSHATQTTESLGKRLNAMFTRLDEEPLVIADSVFGPGVLTASGLQELLLGILYSPGLWSEAMQVLTSVEQGDGTDAYTVLYTPFIDIDRQPYNENVFNRSMQRYLTRESTRPILCGDAAATNISVNALTNYFRELGKISPVGEQWGKFVGICNGWAFRASQRYAGPWAVANGLKKTRFPILFLSLDADPVTPLSSAVKMSRGFGKESATLLVQQGTSHPSLCTYKHVHDYFVDGKVPPNGTHCTPDTNSKRATSMLDEREERLLEALHKLREARSKFNPNIFGI
ncbi:hypothetical protein FRC10_009289 [Ceratobasidium sp. 414]|nr:hypothetical protein FRC10_009289 [Ceratobasidium sp. 414]